MLSETSEITLLLMVFVAGRKSVAGVILGAIVIEYLTTSTSFISTNIGIIEGIALLVILLVGARRGGGSDGPAPRPPDGPVGRGPRVVERGAAQDAGHRRHEEVGTVRETPPEVNGPGSSAGSGRPAADAGRAVLACYDVTKSYGGVLAVDSVSLEVPPRGAVRPVRL